MKKPLEKWIFIFIGIITSQILLSSFSTKNTDLTDGLKKNQHNKPNMNKLATAGILFQNAYVATSICNVSRASILTSQYESNHHVNDFRTDLSQQSISNSYPALLKKAGYAVGYNKIIIQPEITNLQWAKATYNSVLGEINSCWKKTAFTFPGRR